MRQRQGRTVSLFSPLAGPGPLGDDYTRFDFHRPRRKRIALRTASSEKATAIAQNAPCGPTPKIRESTYANGISNTQKQRRLRSVGVSVSPAPLNDCVSTRP